MKLQSQCTPEIAWDLPYKSQFKHLFDNLKQQWLAHYTDVFEDWLSKALKKDPLFSLKEAIADEVAVLLRGWKDTTSEGRERDDQYLTILLQERVKDKNYIPVEWWVKRLPLIGSILHKERTPAHFWVDVEPSLNESIVALTQIEEAFASIWDKVWATHARDFLSCVTFIQNAGPIPQWSEYRTIQYQLYAIERWIAVATHIMHTMPT